MEREVEHFPFGKPKLSRRQEILRAASELFGEHGVQSVTTRQIAAKVGVSQPSLYAHFRSVQEMQDELTSLAFEILENKTAKADSEGLSPEELLRSTIKNYFEFGIGNPVAYKIAFIVEITKKDAYTQEQYDALDHPGVRAFRHITSVIGRVRPDLDERHILIVSKLLWATLHGLISLLLMRSEFPWGDAEELIAEQSRSAHSFVLKYAG